MSYSDCLETQRLNLPNKGKACIKGPTTLDLKEVVMEADLRLTGTLNGNDPERALCGCLRPTQVVVSELVGFWEMWGDDDEAFKWFKEQEKLMEQRKDQGYVRYEVTKEVRHGVEV